MSEQQCIYMGTCSQTCKNTCILSVYDRILPYLIVFEAGNKINKIEIS
nr:MAG TPA: hypothetical protein [Caudoviricetes sp.]